MASAVSNLLIYQGADFITDFTIENDNGTFFDLTGYTAACKIKKNYTSSTSTTVSVQILNPATAGQIQLSLGHATTTAMKPGRYVYDVELTNGSVVTRILEGIAEVRPNATI